MNRFITRWARFVIEKRWLVIIACTAITVVSLFGFKQLYFFNKFTSWLSPHDPDISLFMKTSEKFSINELVLVVIHPREGLFKTKALNGIKQFTETLQNRREIFYVSSLSSIADIKKTDNGLEIGNLLEEIPASPGEMKRFRDYVLSKPGYRGNVVSADGKWAALSVFIDSRLDSEQVVKKIIFPESEKFFADWADVYFSGIPSDALFITDFAMRDLKGLTPAIFLLIAIILFISFRTLSGILFPSLVVVLSSVWLFGLIGYLRHPLTFVTSAIPVLLTALGSAYGIHVLNKYYHDSDTGGKSSQTKLIRSTSDICIPVTLAGATTFIGFLSFQSAGLRLIADFGLFSAIGIVFSLFIALSLIPALGSFIHFKPREKIQSSLLRKLLARMAELSIKRKLIIFLISVLILGLFLAGIPQIKKEMNFSEYFPRNSIPRISHDMVARHFEGAYPVIFYFNAPNCKAPEILRLMRRTENYLLSIKTLSTPVSVSSLIEELNFQLNDRYALPDGLSGINNLWFFLEGRKEIGQMITEDGKEALVFSKSNQTTTEFNKLLYNQFDQFIQETFKKQKPHIYDLKNLSGKNKKKVIEMEINFLLDEISWVSHHYLDRDPDRRLLSRTLKDLLFQQERSADNRLNEKQLVALRRYINSESFDFRLNRQEKQRILNNLEDETRRQTISRESIIKILQMNVPRSDYESEVAVDVARSILYQYRDVRDKWLANRIWSRLNSQFHSRDREFEKRITSIIYDLLDDTALVPWSSIGNLRGRMISLDLLAQSGTPTMLARLDVHLNRSQYQSLIIAYFLTLIIMIIMRKSLVMGIISTLPIIFTTAIIYGFLGHSGIPLDYATMMIGSISIGIGIDYAIHFTHGIIRQTAKGNLLEDAIRKTFVEKGTAIVSNALAVMAGFAILLFSSMLIMRNFGGTMVGSMFLASLSTLTVLPSSILLLKPRLKKEKKYEKKATRQSHVVALFNRHKRNGYRFRHHTEKG